MYIPHTTFQHSFHHSWGTCHSVAPVFVSLHCRMMPPAMQSTASLTSLSSWNRRPARKDLRCRNKWKSLGTTSGLWGGMIELFPAKCSGEILCYGGSVWVGVAMNHQNTQVKHATSLILDHMAKFFKCVAIDTCVDWKVLRQEVHKQNAFSVPKHCAHDLSWSGLLEFRLCWRWSVTTLHGLLLWFRGFVRHQCLVPCDYMAQEVFAFLNVSCQNVQRTRLPFQFVFFHKHLRHTACTELPKRKFIRQNFMKERQWNFRKMQGKWCNGESSVLSNLLFNCTHQIFIHHRRSATPQIITHIFTSSLNSRTHLHTTELLILHTRQKVDEFQPVSCSSHSRNGLDHISHAVGFSIFLNIINTQHDV